MSNSGLGKPKKSWMVRGRAIAVTATVGTYQCAETIRMARGRGKEAPMARQASVYRLRSSAFMGLPWPRKAAGMWVMASMRGGYAAAVDGGRERVEQTFPTLAGSAGRGITYVITSTGRAPMKLKITTIGNSAGVILPKELLSRLRLEKGDELYAVETPDGVRLTAYDPELAAQMEVAEDVMRRRRTLLHKLAQ